MTEFVIEVVPIRDGSAALRWPDAPEPADVETLRIAVVAAAEDVLGRGRHRVEATRPAGDLLGRRALLLSGFRQEGVLRQAAPLPDGGHGDLVVYARLASDAVHGQTGFSGVMNSALPRKRLIAHVVMRDEGGRVLLCQTTFKPDWELPGGIVEPGEPPRQGAVREVKEELGVDREIGRLLVVDWLPPYLGWEDACELIFDGGPVTTDDLAGFVLDQREIAAVRLCTLEEAAGLVTEGAHRRLTAACTVADGETAYTEHGRRV
ncbi:NUDIX domain-containing protein [Microlunatus parietis]|uniref:8-oxo-dGTP pyrophosphatase MutT (NUDIX family) n=1 Tax=Microlunatus parietis TaxID=682979 RepID=A0A7Y9I3I8_9ACTN|nr:NUDIX hydrolase [Microlunatus parietis]NYE69274.1 8-oxo-dGTP pyrophosphatase MutT (NUDIX family) [Microlunatus parietis]